MGARIYRAECTFNGLCYKNEGAFNNKRGVCYIPEYAFPSRTSGEVYGTAKECKNVYTYKDFLDLAEGNEKLARALFDEVDWQYPESRLYEMDIEEFKTITIKYSNDNWENLEANIEDSRDLEYLYNEFIEHNQKLGIEEELLYKIVAYSGDIWNNIPHGTYDIEDFEKLALSIIERENNHKVANMWSLACSDNLDNYELTIILLQLAYGKNYCRSAMHGLIKTIYEIEDIGDLTNEFRKDFMIGKTMNINNRNYEPILAIPGYYFVRYL